MVVEFLNDLYNQGYNYGQLSMARSAVSSVVINTNNIPLGKNTLIKRYMKGVFEINPQLPRYKYIWDVSILLDYFRKLDDPKHLPVGMLGKKLALMLVILAGGQRCQTIHAINTKHIKVTHDRCYIPLYDTLKQTRQGHHLKPLSFSVYTQEPKLCVIYNLTNYLAKTKSNRSDEALFISYQKPYKPIKKDTLSGWCRQVMSNAGVDNFVTHSSRSAAASFASVRGASLKDICDACGWSSARTFANHYQKRIEDTRSIAQFVLPK